MANTGRARHRIVSLAPSATSILIALGARRSIVGVSKWCKHVADVRGLPELGDCWSLDPKTVAALHPTLVIGSVPFKAETVGRLLEQPVPFLAKNPRSIDDIYNDIQLLGSILGRTGAARQTIARMKKTFASFARRASKAPSHPRVYCEAWPKPRISSPPWVAELVEACGGVFAVPPGQRVGDEQVAQANPEVVVLAWTAAGSKSKRHSALRNSAWQDVSAVRTRRVHVLPDHWLNTPALPLLEGARALFHILHPEMGMPHDYGGCGLN